nr:hypothetical protein CFP56_21964 [Quercus suber]
MDEFSELLEHMPAIRVLRCRMLWHCMKAHKADLLGTGQMLQAEGDQMLRTSNILSSYYEDKSCPNASFYRCSALQLYIMSCTRCIRGASFTRVQDASRIGHVDGGHLCRIVLRRGRSVSAHRSGYVRLLLPLSRCEDRIRNMGRTFQSTVWCCMVVDPCSISCPEQPSTEPVALLAPLHEHATGAAAQAGAIGSIGRELVRRRHRRHAICRVVFLGAGKHFMRAGGEVEVQSIVHLAMPLRSFALHGQWAALRQRIDRAAAPAATRPGGTKHRGRWRPRRRTS